jgi:hypothetical protein
MLEAMCLEPWDLKLVQANNTPDEQSFYRVKDERVYRGYLSEGDRLRSSATINGINGYISTHARVYFDNGSDFDFRLSSENDFELMDALKEYYKLSEDNKRVIRDLIRNLPKE